MLLSGRCPSAKSARGVICARHYVLQSRGTRPARAFILARRKHRCPVSKRVPLHFRWLDAALAAWSLVLSQPSFRSAAGGLAGNPRSSSCSGTRALPRPSSWVRASCRAFDLRRIVFGVATLVHFTLSIAYGVALCALLSLAGGRLVDGEHVRGNRIRARPVCGQHAWVYGRVPMVCGRARRDHYRNHAVFGVAVVVAYGARPPPGVAASQLDRAGCAEARAAPGFQSGCLLTPPVAIFRRAGAILTSFGRRPAGGRRLVPCISSPLAHFYSPKSGIRRLAIERSRVAI